MVFVVFSMLRYSNKSKIILKTLMVIGFFGLGLPPLLSAHGDLHEQIEQISKKIKQDPKDAALYLKRGQLYAQHEDIDRAKKDYDKARSLNKKLIITDLLLAKLLKTKQAERALVHVNLFLGHQANDVEGLLSRASIYQQLQKEELAKRDLESAYDKLKNPLPKHYIFLLEATLRADTSNVEEALAWLEKGQSQFGFDIVLKEKEIELLTQNRQYDRALRVLDSVLEHFQRKEKWLFLKGQICLMANKKEAALNHYNATLEAIQKLPKRLQLTGKMLELEAMTIQKIQILSK